MCLNNRSGGKHLKIHVLTQAAMTKIPQTGCLKHRDLFPTVLKASSPRSGCQQIWLPGKGLLPDGCLPTVSSSEGGEKRALVSLLILWTLILSRNPILMTSSEPKQGPRSPSQIAPHWESGLRHIKLRAHKASFSS